MRPQRKQKALRNNPLGLTLRGSNRRAAELVQHPGADVAVPLVVARRDLDEIEAHHLPPAASQPVQQVREPIEKSVEDPLNAI